MNKKVEEKQKINLSEIPLSSSLGLLAYGDIAFTAWRKVKKEKRDRDNAEK